MGTGKENQAIRISRAGGVGGADALAVMAQALTQAADSAQLAARAQEALAKTTVSVTRALKNAVAGFDELHLATQDSFQTRAERMAAAKKEAAKRASGGGSGGGRGSATKSSAKEAAEEEANAFAAMLAAAHQAAQQFASMLQSVYLPSILAWGQALSEVRTAAVNAFSYMRDSAVALWQDALAPLANYVLWDFLPSIANAFSTVFAPIFSEVAALALEVFANGFAVACAVVENAVNTLLMPAFALVKTIFTDMFAAVGAMWAEYGEPLIEGVHEAFMHLFSLLQSLYDTVLQPVLANILAMLSTLWTDALAPLWENLMMLLGEIGVMLLALWNNVLAPFGSFLLDKLGPVFVALSNTVAETFGSIARVVAQVVNGLLDALRGLCSFLTGVFTGDWSRAWEGVKSIFSGVWDAMQSLLRGAVNAIIGMVNSMARSVAGAINAVIGGLNSIQVTIPAWVPVYGGKSFGVNLPGVGAPQIPYLARGAVIPPNAEFLAVLGDQRHGRNLETPENLLRQIVREEGGARELTVEQPIALSLDGDVFYRAMARIREGRGVEVSGVFAHAY